VLDISATGAFSGNNLSADFGKAADRNGQTVDFWYDDIMMSSSSAPPAGRVVYLRANGDGNYIAFTAGTNASDYLEVDDVPVHDSSTYAEATAQNDATTYTVEPPGAANINGVINAVGGYVMVQRTLAEGTTGQLRLRNGGNDSDSTDANFAVGSWRARGGIYATDPADSGSWEVVDLEHVEIGCVDTDDNSRVRISMAGIMVDYAPPDESVLGDATLGDAVLGQ